MKNIDDLLKRANKFKFDYATRYGAALLNELAATIRAQQAEIERLKGEYARGIEDAAKSVLDKAHELERKECCLCPVNSSSHDGEPECCGDPAYNIHGHEAAETIRALLPKQEECE